MYMSVLTELNKEIVSITAPGAAALLLHVLRITGTKWNDAHSSQSFWIMHLAGGFILKTAGNQSSRRRQQEEGLPVVAQETGLRFESFESSSGRGSVVYRPPMVTIEATTGGNATIETSSHLAMDSALDGPLNGSISLAPLSGVLGLMGSRIHATTERELTFSSESCCRGITIDPPNGVLTTSATTLLSTSTRHLAIESVTGDIVLTPQSGVVRVNGEIRSSGGTPYASPAGDVTTAGSVLRGLAAGGLTLENAARDITIQPASGSLQFNGTTIVGGSCSGLELQTTCGPLALRASPALPWKSREIFLHGNIFLPAPYEMQVTRRFRTAHRTASDPQFTLPCYSLCRSTSGCASLRGASKAWTRFQREVRLSSSGRMRRRTP